MDNSQGSTVVVVWVMQDLQGLLEKAKGEIVGLKEQLSKATKSSSSKMKGEAAEKKVGLIGFRKC